MAEVGKAGVMEAARAAVADAKVVDVVVGATAKEVVTVDTKVEARVAMEGPEAEVMAGVVKALDSMVAAAMVAEPVQMAAKVRVVMVAVS
jgi:hypothetical protein